MSRRENTCTAKYMTGACMLAPHASHDTPLPLPGQAQVSPMDFFADLSDTLACVAGNAPRLPVDKTCETTPGPWFVAIFYFGFNLSFNVCLLYLTKTMSANWAQVATVFRRVFLPTYTKLLSRELLSHETPICTPSQSEFSLTPLFDVSNR